MNVYAILVEPASYTIDRNKAVYDPLGIDYCYLKSSSLASDLGNDAICLENYSFFKKIKFIRTTLNQNDIVIMNGYVHFEFIILLVLNLFFRKKIGVDSDTQFSQPKNILKRWIKFIYLNFIFKRKNLYGLAGGTKNHYDLFIKFGMPKSHVYLMPMIVDNKKFENLNYQSKIKDTFNYIYVGRIIEQKNVKLIIDSFISVSTKFSNSKLIIVGDGELLPCLKKDYNNNEKIIFTGPKFGNDLVEFYKIGHALVLPSLYEPWGLVVNEALSAGLPVIVSSEVGASHDLVLKANTGFILKNLNRKELSNRMIDLIENEELYSDFSNNAFNYMKNNWNFDFYRECLISFLKFKNEQEL
jgi:glycosyltransferase involved in cell wall biosynthesis